jgi:hypothetical protein
MNLVKTFENAFKRKEERGWDRIYVFVDIHDTIFKSDYGVGKNLEFYKYCQDVLITLSNMEDVVLGLLTSSYDKDIQEYQKVFKKCGINFQLVNENPMEKNTKVACFDKKPYFNVLIDDKAGFDAESDWFPIHRYLWKKINY